MQRGVFVSDANSTTERSRTSRRTVVRTAAHAAWAVPAIQIATSVPAFAAVSNKLLLSTFTARWSGPGNSTKLTITATIKNDDGNTAATAVTFTVTFPAGYGNITGAAAPTGYTAVTTGTSVTYTYSGTIAAGSTLNFTSEINVQTRGTGQIAGTVASAGWSGDGKSTIPT